MLIIAFGWLFVVGLYALGYATAPQGSLLGALAMLVFAGVLPLAVVLYLMGAPARRSARRRAEAARTSAADPDGGGHAAGDAVAPKREET